MAGFFVWGRTAVFCRSVRLYTPSGMIKKRFALLAKIIHTAQQRFQSHQLMKIQTLDKVKK